MVLNNIVEVIYKSNTITMEETSISLWYSYPRAKPEAQQPYHHHDRIHTINQCRAFGESLETTPRWSTGATTSCCYVTVDQGSLSRWDPNRYQHRILFPTSYSGWTDHLRGNTSFTDGVCRNPSTLHLDRIVELNRGQGGNYFNVPSLYGPEHIRAWKKITDAVHAKGAYMFCQIWHV